MLAPLALGRARRCLVGVNLFSSPRSAIPYPDTVRCPSRASGTHGRCRAQEITVWCFRPPLALGALGSGSVERGWVPAPAGVRPVSARRLPRFSLLWVGSVPCPGPSGGTLDYMNADVICGLVRGLPRRRRLRTGLGRQGAHLLCRRAREYGLWAVAVRKASVGVDVAVGIWLAQRADQGRALDT